MNLNVFQQITYYQIYICKQVNTWSSDSQSRGALVKPSYPIAEPDFEWYFLLHSSLLQTS